MTNSALQIPAALRFLIVEDFLPFRAMLREMVTAHPTWTVLAEIGDGLTAVSLFDRLRPDVVLMDCLMPQMNGIQATRQIKAVAPTTKIILFTAHMHESLRRASHEAGVDHFLAKEELNAQVLRQIVERLWQPQ